MGKDEWCAQCSRFADEAERSTGDVTSMDCPTCKRRFLVLVTRADALRMLAPTAWRDFGERGTGHTSQQMREAPHGAVFVWCNDILDYPRRLAIALERTDLRIVGTRALTNGNLRSLRSDVVIVVDHATRLTDHECAALNVLRERHEVRAS